MKAVDLRIEVYENEQTSVCRVIDHFKSEFKTGIKAIDKIPIFYVPHANHTIVKVIDTTTNATVFSMEGSLANDLASLSDKLRSLLNI